MDYFLPLYNMNTMTKFDNYIEKIRDKHILIQGLGLNGGGVGTEKFFL